MLTQLASLTQLTQPLDQAQGGHARLGWVRVKRSLSHLVVTVGEMALTESEARELVDTIAERLPRTNRHSPVAVAGSGGMIVASLAPFDSDAGRRLRELTRQVEPGDLERIVAVGIAASLAASA